MSRVLTVYERSTPTYLFNITDYNSSGVDLTGMKAMMCLKITDASSTPAVCYRYVIDSFDSEFTYNEENTWADPTYCRNLGNGMFAITVPFWRYGGTVSSIEYQVFLYGNVTEAGRATNIDGTLITGGRVRHHNILIDSGTIEVEDSLFPLTSSARVAQTLHGTGLINVQDASRAYNIDPTFYIVGRNTGLYLGEDLNIDKETVATLLEICVKVAPTITTPEQIRALTIDESEALFKEEIEGYAEYDGADTAPEVV